MLTVTPTAKSVEVISRRKFPLSPVQQARSPGSSMPGSGLPLFLQPKLAISQPDDPSEVEADRVADQVMRMSVPTVQRQCAVCEEEEVPVSRKAEGAVAGEAPRSVHATLRSSGQPLASSTRAFFEPRFGQDLSQIRVHTDPEAQQSAREVNALAYTVGSHVVFDAGRYAPGTLDGQRLLAHELVHTIQSQTHERESQIIRRKPGENPQESWDSFIEMSVAPPGGEEETRAKEAVNRLLASKNGAVLINLLWRLACSGASTGTCGGKIFVRFVDKNTFDQLNPDAMGEAGGRFTPSARNAFPYTVYVVSAVPRKGFGTRLNVTWGAGENAVMMSHKDIESDMATTLFHELLHIKFINDGVRRRFPTGHGDTAKGEIDPEFSDILAGFDAQLVEIEKAPASTKARPSMIVQILRAAAKAQSAAGTTAMIRASEVGYRMISAFLPHYARSISGIGYDKDLDGVRARCTDMNIDLTVGGGFISRLDNSTILALVIELRDAIRNGFHACKFR